MPTNKPRLLGSSPTRDGIVKVIVAFYCGANITLHDNPDGTIAVHNSHGLLKSVRVVQVKGRFRFEAV